METLTVPWRNWYFLVFTDWLHRNDNANETMVMFCYSGDNWYIYVLVINTSLGNFTICPSLHMYWLGYLGDSYGQLKDAANDDIIEIISLSIFIMWKFSSIYSVVCD